MLYSNEQGGETQLVLHFMVHANTFTWRHFRFYRRYNITYEETFDLESMPFCSPSDVQYEPRYWYRGSQIP